MSILVIDIGTSGLRAAIVAPDVADDGADGQRPFRSSEVWSMR